MYSVYDRIFGNLCAENTVYTPYVYGSGQPQAWHTSFSAQLRHACPIASSRQNIDSTLLINICIVTFLADYCFPRAHNTHIHTHAHAHAHTHTHTHIHTHIRTHTYTHTHTHIHTRTHSRIHTHTHTHTRMHAHTRTNTHTTHTHTLSFKVHGCTLACACIIAIMITHIHIITQAWFIYTRRHDSYIHASMIHIYTQAWLIYTRMHDSYIYTQAWWTLTNASQKMWKSFASPSATCE